MKMRLVSAAVAGAGLWLSFAAMNAVGQTPAPAAPSAKAGEGVFERYCTSCHTLDGTSEIAPSLKGISGRRVASTKYPAYSEALKAAHKKGDRWTDERLEAYISHPDGVYKGTAMSVRIQSPSNRANLMAYLKTLK